MYTNRFIISYWFILQKASMIINNIGERNHPRGLSANQMVCSTSLAPIFAQEQTEVWLRLATYSLCLEAKIVNSDNKVILTWYKETTDLRLLQTEVVLDPWQTWDFLQEFSQPGNIIYKQERILYKTTENNTTFIHLYYWSISLLGNISIIKFHHELQQ